MARLNNSKQSGGIPTHVAIIMDGNGRWAKKRGLPRTAGHTAGAATFRHITRYASRIGIKYLTVYAFSTENWKRPADDHIWELERTVLTTYRGNYSSYVVQKKERVERQLKEYEQQQEQIKSMEEFVAKNIARASTSKSAKSRLAALERMDRIEKPVIWEKKAAFSFEYDEPPVKDVFHGENMSIAVGEGENRKVLCRNMRLDVMRGEKIAIIGPNGVGKSSLLKAIQELIPLEEGSFEWGQKVKTTYYEQENRQLHPEKTAINEIWDRFPNMYEVEVRNILGRVLLSVG